MTLVLSDWTLLAIPKSMSLRRPATSRKLAGFRSECIIPCYKTTTKHYNIGTYKFTVLGLPYGNADPGSGSSILYGNEDPDPGEKVTIIFYTHMKMDRQASLFSIYLRYI